ncbi:MAG: CheB methylesterase domain-containing protein [Actinomycetota bacterium]
MTARPPVHPAVDADPLERRSLPVVAMAASAGGPNAVASVLQGLEGLPAAIIVVQHIQPQFLNGFVEWMQRASTMSVRVAADGMRLQPATVYVGPSGRHVRLTMGRRIVLGEDPDVTHRPSADELFISVAAHAGASAIGVLLTGMGDDGARGLLQIRRRGGITIVQDEGSSAVYGMPGAAVKLEAAQAVLPLDQIPAAIRRAARKVRP